MTRWVLCAGLAVTVVCGPAGAQRGLTEPLRGLDGYVARAVREWGIPGLAIGVVKDDSLVWARGFGVRRLGDTARVTPRTIFAIGSCTKAFTVATLAMLVDSSRLAWDDPVTRYLTGFQLADPYVTRELTIRDLLTHRSGLPRGDALWYATPYDRDEVLRRIRFLQPSWSFRSHYGYQNIMVLAAGQIIPVVMGVSWDDFVRQRLFVPLGMTATSTSIEALDSTQELATPHERFKDRERSIAWRNVDNIGPAGAINSNVHDLAQWMRLLLTEGLYRGERLLSASTIREMWSPQTIIPLDTLTARLRPSTHFEAYGLGWVLSDYRGRELVAHGGAIDGFRAIVGLVPEEHLGVVVLTNGGEPGRELTTALYLRVVDAYLGGRGRDWSADLLQVRNRQMARDSSERAREEASRVAGTAPALALPAYAGTYRNELYGDVTVTVDSGVLFMRFGPYYNAALSHWQYDTFKAAWQDPEEGYDLMTFTLNAGGRVDHLTWPGLGDFVRLEEGR
jgi:CubicO group peptidase (beta-lactamase class C family)